MDSGMNQEGALVARPTLVRIPSTEGMKEKKRLLMITELPSELWFYCNFDLKYAAICYLKTFFDHRVQGEEIELHLLTIARCQGEEEKSNRVHTQ